VLNLGAGGGGVDAAHVNNIVAAVFYGVFGVTGTFGGSTLNTLGPRYTLMVCPPPLVPEKGADLWPADRCLWIPILHLRPLVF
jgi:hypothetical protein